MAKKKTTRSNGNKTTLTDASVEEYLANITDEARRADCEALVRIFSSATRKPPKMWGSAIVGFDQYHYTYESGREGDMCAAGFSSRKGPISLYISTAGQEDLLAKLGKFKTSKAACIYINRVADVDESVLKKLVAAGVAAVKKRYS
jgi:Domain of unknown function (DU1801)